MIYYLGGKPTIKRRSTISRRNLNARVIRLRKQYPGKTICCYYNFAIRRDASWMMVTVRDYKDE